MRTIYLDDDYKCHAAPGDGLAPVETDFFDGKTDAYIRGYRYVPEGASWTDGHGNSYAGEMICPAEDYTGLIAAQQADEHAALTELGAAGVLAPSIEVRAVRAAMDIAGEQLSDEQADEVACLFRIWESNTAYKAGERRRYDGTLYKCLQAHTSQDNWTPPSTPALWVSTSTEEWPLIPNPILSTSPWMAGQKGRTADGRRWESLIDNNVWQPSAYPQGWKEWTV